MATPDDDVFTSDEPFYRRQWTGENIAELRAFTGQEDLTVNADGTVTVRTGVPGAEDGLKANVPEGWYVKVYVVNHAVGVMSPGVPCRRVQPA